LDELNPFSIDDALPQAVKEFVAQSYVDRNIIVRTEEDTQKQAVTPQWWEYRTHRLTASSFGEILHVAIHMRRLLLGLAVTDIDGGFITRPDLPHLGCSPDRKDPDKTGHPHHAILEVKCSVKYR